LKPHLPVNRRSGAVGVWALVVFISKRNNVSCPIIGIFKQTYRRSMSIHTSE